MVDVAANTSVNRPPAVVPVTDTEGDKAHATAVVVVGTNGIARDIGAADVISVTLSLDTSGAYATGDVLADTQVVTGAFRIADGRAVLRSLTVHDEDDQGIALDLVFLSANVSIGTENAAVSVTDANARSILGIVSIAGADFIDLGGVRVASKTAIGLMLEAASGVADLYVAAISRGVGTYTAAGIVLRLGLEQLN
jgi:hypothetical protein